MAAEGITSSVEIIEGARGFLAVNVTRSGTRQAARRLGDQWHLLANGYKAYPSGSLTTPRSTGCWHCARARLRGH